MSEPSLDRARLSGHEGHHSCALRKTGTEAESRDALLTAIAKARGWINDIRLGRIPHELDSRLFGVRSGGSRRRRWIWPGCPGGARRIRALAKDQS